MSTAICKNQKLCTGCAACYHTCPRQCIEMKCDNEGFYYPVIDNVKCINCGLCAKICPVNSQIVIHDVIKGFVLRHKDLEIVENSTSGGISAALAEYTFERNGSLFGVGYDEHLKVRHFVIDSCEKHRIVEMRGSKYVQSDLGDSFLQVKRLLDAEVFVCFVGTPCQVAGLKSYLKKDYEKLLTVDLVCHGVASPKVFQKYIEYQTAKYGAKPADVRFRNKTYGYHSGTMKILFENGKQYYGSGRIDYMLKAYFAGACSRYSCYQCAFKGRKRCSDLTIFDSWHIERLVETEKDDDRGYTNVYAHTDKGIKVLYDLSRILDIWEADPDVMEQLDGVMIRQNPKMSNHRASIIREIDNLGFEKAMQKYLPITVKDHMLERVKAIVYKTGLLKIISK